ncbi:hypothetical protein [Dysgonomonas sp. GY75]|uniref:hypothetical protein n=1 Tax=Dysgonomonas sp. GY75 TaxID=2780419 RepID=UPI0018F0353A|nr:hypothetical protein [Dysgonomonas sp. GY75]
MIDVKDILSRNARKHKEINRPYNPVTGEGCEGKRVCLRIEDAPFPVMYLPEEMMETGHCRQLQEYDSIEGLYRANDICPDEEEFEAFWINFCELRIKYDFEFFAVFYVTIRDKISGRDIPFRLNRGQRRLLSKLEAMRKAGVPIRVILLKARQWGGSTLIQLYMFWIQLVHKKNWNSVICAHLKDASITIRAMFERSVKNMMPVGGVVHTIRNYEKTQNIKEVPERGCLITVGTAEEPDSVRSQDAKMVHFSEIAFYPNTEKNKTEDLVTSIVGSIPREPLTLVAFESTANGVGDFFYNECEKAKKESAAYTFVFVEWFLIDIYREAFDGTFYNHRGKKREGTVEEFIKTLTDYELNLFRNNEGCTLENINWYRGKLSEMPSHAKMKQEYPSDDIEAFQDSGLPAFRAEEVEALRKDCRMPVAIGELAGDCPPALSKPEPKRVKEILQNIRFIEDREALADMHTSDPVLKAIKERNKLKIWEFPDTEIRVSNRYLVVFDPQKGISESADWGVITVIDRYWMMHGCAPEIVAEWRGRIDKDVSIWIAAQIARYYNDALLVIESNTYDTEIKTDESELIFDTLVKYYTNLYSRTPADKIREGLPAKYGFHTNISTKTMIIANYVAVLREKGYIERNGEALNEARVYEQKKNGSYGAKEGKHDDMLMTRMIGLYICFQLALPVLLEEVKKQKVKRPVGESSF